MKESLESPKNKENFLESLLFKVFPIRLFKKLSVLTGEYFRTIVRDNTALEIPFEVAYLLLFPTVAL